MRSVLSTLVMLALSAFVGNAALIVDDSFDGDALSGGWVARLSTDATATVTNGSVTLDTVLNINGQRSFISMQKSEFDFYNNSLSVSVTGLDLVGTAASANLAPYFFFGIADADFGIQLTPAAAKDGQFFAIKRILSGENQINQLWAMQRVNGVTTNTVLANLGTSEIGGVEITMDGDDWYIEVKGAGGGTLGTGSGHTFSGVEANYSEFNFVMGTYNSSTPTVGGSMSIDGIQISTVPEPASVSLFSLSAVLIAVIRKCRS